MKNNSFPPINHFNQNINQIIRRKKHNGETIIGDKIISGRRYYNKYNYKLPTLCKNNSISISNQKGKYNKYNTNDIFFPSINMVGFSFKERINNLKILYKHGRLKLGNSSKTFKKLIINSRNI